jgi:uncharacterized protein YgfB (UPF0149 family)
MFSKRILAEDGNVALEGADALQLYVSRLVVNVGLLNKQRALLEQAVADQDRMLRELQNMLHQRCSAPE